MRLLQAERRAQEAEVACASLAERLLDAEEALRKAEEARRISEEARRSEASSAVARATQAAEQGRELEALLAKRSGTFEAEMQLAQDNLSWLRQQEFMFAERARSACASEQAAQAYGSALVERAAETEGMLTAEVAQHQALARRADLLESELWRAETGSQRAVEALKGEFALEVQACVAMEQAGAQQARQSFAANAESLLLSKSVQLSGILGSLLGAELTVERRTEATESAVAEAGRAAEHLLDASRLANVSQEVLQESANLQTADALRAIDRKSTRLNSSH